MSLMVSYFVLSFFSRDASDEIWDWIESDPENFPTYFFNVKSYVELKYLVDDKVISKKQKVICSTVESLFKVLGQILSSRRERFNDKDD